MEEVRVRAERIYGEFCKGFRIGGAKEFAEVVERCGIEHSRVLADGFVGDAFSQSVDVAAQRREDQGRSGSVVACLHRFKI